MNKLAAGRDHRAGPGHGMVDGACDGDELIGDRLHGGTQHVRRLAAERQPGDHRSGVAAPVRAALAGPEGKHGEAVAVWWNGGGCTLQRFVVLLTEPGGEPAHHVAAFAQGAAQDVALSIEPVDEGAPRDGQVVLVEDDA